MFHSNLHHMETAAEHLTQMLPPAFRDDVSLSTLLRSDELYLVLVLPPHLSHLRNRLPSVVDGVHVLYQVAEPLSLN
jgi:hypothetical protein